MCLHRVATSVITFVILGQPLDANMCRGCQVSVVFAWALGWAFGFSTVCCKALNTTHSIRRQPKIAVCNKLLQVNQQAKPPLADDHGCCAGFVLQPSMHCNAKHPQQQCCQLSELTDGCKLSYNSCHRTRACCDMSCCSLVFT